MESAGKRQMQIEDSVLRNYFLGEGFAKPRLKFLKFVGNSFWISRAGRVWEGMRAGFFGVEKMAEKC